MPTICVWGAHRNVEAGGQPQMPFIRYHPPFYYLFGTGLLNGLVWNSTWRLAGRPASSGDPPVSALSPHTSACHHAQIYLFFF